MITIEYTSPVSEEGGEGIFNQKSSKLCLNLKNRKISQFVLEKIIPRVHIVIESYRPEVMERFGLGPAEVHQANKKVIYVRISGYGHSPTAGDLKFSAGRDLNFLAASGLLSQFRRNSKNSVPSFPGNILTYYASGSLYVFNLIMQALIARSHHTVIDCALTTNAAYLGQPSLLNAHFVRPILEPGKRANNF